MAPSRAILLSFSLAYVAQATSLAAITMSTEDALQRLNGQLNHQVVALMHGLHHQKKKAPKTMSFLEVRSGRVSKQSMEAKNVDEAREKLNGMVEATQEKLDKEVIKCEATIRNQKAVLEETRVDIALYSSQSTQAAGDHVRASGSMSDLEASRSIATDELTSSKQDCALQIHDLKVELDVMLNDSAVLQNLVETVACPKASFLQCRDAQGSPTTMFGEQEWRTQMTQLKSDKSKGLLNAALALGYSTGQQQDSLDHDLPGHEGGCSIATNPDCAKLVDKFLEISGELESDIGKFEEHISTKLQECKSEHANYEAQVSDLTGRIESWETALAEAVKRVIEANEGIRLKAQQKEELDQQFAETKRDCQANIGTFHSEMCAFNQIRGELYKMSDASAMVQVEDCQVSDWRYDECSKACIEGDSDQPGTQNVTRDVENPGYKGAKCPPLRLTQVCNTIQCPIDCHVEEWSEWSSCSTKCGGGIRERIRSIKRHERHGGQPCGPASDTETCSLQSCDKDCELGPWTKLSSMKCDVACGGGMKWSVREVEKPAEGQGKCPDPYSEERYRLSPCNTFPCHAAGDTLVCDSMVDVVILLDGSGSLGASGWAATKKMGEKLVRAFNSDAVQPNAQVAVQAFSGPKTWSQYNRCLNKPWQRGWVWARRGRRRRWGRRWGWVWPKTVQPPLNMVTDCGIKWETPLTVDTGHFTKDMTSAATKVKDMVWPEGSTFTSMALAQAGAELMFSREGAMKVVVVVTDGIPINPLLTGRAAEKLKGKARLIWVPVTTDAPQEQLEEWATKPKEQNIVKVADFTTLEKPDVVTQIIREVCPDAK
jgi:hypothetical protein